MDVDAASRLGLGGLGREDDGDVLGSTTLGVLDGSTGLGARSAVLAGFTVRHVVVELKVAVKLGLQGDVAEGELVRTLGTTTAKRGRLLLLGAA